MDDTRLAIYLGKNITTILPNSNLGVFTRGLPRLVDDKSPDAQRIRDDLFPEFQILNNESGYIGSSNTLESFEPISESLKPGDRLLIMRDMGLGDIILSLPTVREIRARLPDVHITYATSPRYFELLHKFDAVDRVVDLEKVDLSGGRYDLVINFIRCLEHYNILRNCGRRVESFYKMIGIKHIDNLVVSPTIKRRDERAVDAMLNGLDSPFVAYVLKAAAWNRTYPIWKAREVVEQLHAHFPAHVILIVDNQPNIGLFNGLDYVRDLSGKTKSIMQAGAVFKRCDIVIAPDTGAAHVAAALGVKTLILLSSQPFDWRYDHYGDHVHYILNEWAAPCVPCWDWQRERGHMKYCDKDKKNHCLLSISPQQINNKVVELLSVNEQPPWGHDVSTCILTCSNSSTIGKCITALDKNNTGREILILLNGADKSTVKHVLKITSEISNVIVIHSDKNIGIIRGRNLLSDIAKGRYLFFIDDDQVVSENSISKLYSAVDNGHVAAGVEFHSVDPVNGIGGNKPNTKDPKYNYMGAGGLMIRRKTFIDLGGFDTGFGMAYCEDADLSWRLQKEKHFVMYITDAGIRHHKQSSLHSQYDFNHDEQYKLSHKYLKEKWPDRFSVIQPSFRMAVLIICHNRFEIFKKCFEQLIEYTNFETTDIFILNNGSTDDQLIKYLNEIKRSNIYVYHSKKNYLCAPGRHELIRRMIANNHLNYDYYFFLDDDIMIETNQYENLINTIFIEYNTSDCIGGLLLNENGTMQDGLCEISRDGTNIMRTVYKPKNNDIVEVGFLCGGFVAMRHETVLNIYPYMKLFLAGYADFDFSNRVKANNKKLLFTNQLCGIHFKKWGAEQSKHDATIWRTKGNIFQSVTRLKSMWNQSQNIKISEAAAIKHFGVTTNELKKLGLEI